MKLLHADATPASLKFLWFYVFGIWFVSVVFDPLPVIAKLPQEIFEPAGAFRYLPESFKMWWFTEPALFWLRIGTLVSLFMAAIKRSWTAGIIASLFLTVYQATVRGCEKISHDDLPMLYAAYCVSLFGLADAWAAKRAGKSGKAANLASIPWISTVFLMLLCYSLLGAHRLARGGMHLFQSDSLKWYMIHNAHHPAIFIPWDVVKVLSEYPWIYPLLKAGFPVITLFELLAPLAIAFHRFRIVFLGVMLSFFVLNWFFMSLIFWQNFLLCLLLFDFSGHVSNGTRWLPFSFQKPVLQFRGRH